MYMAKIHTGSGGQGTPTNTHQALTDVSPPTAHALSALSLLTPTAASHTASYNPQDDITTTSCGSCDKYTYHNHSQHAGTQARPARRQWMTLGYAFCLLFDNWYTMIHSKP